MTRRELARSVNVSEPTITRADASKLAGWGYARIIKGRTVAYVALGEKEGVERLFKESDQRKAKLEEARIRKLGLDADRVEQLNQINREAWIRKGLEVGLAAIEESYDEYRQAMCKQDYKELREIDERCGKLLEDNLARRIDELLAR